MFLLDLFQREGETVEIVQTFFYTLLFIVKYGERRSRRGGGLVKIRENIWCMLDWILTQNRRNTLPLYK